MDAKATYVAMTRHRENVVFYYRKSDFANFKQLTDSVSRYSYKESLEDFKNIENQNKARVFEYKELQIEKALLFKEINSGTANWTEYNELKNQSLKLGREILDNYEPHKLYLHQQGMTREKLEIQCASLSLDAVIRISGMAASRPCSAWTHTVFPESSQIPAAGTSCKEILSNYPLHREFVNQVSKEFFLSKKLWKIRLIMQIKCWRRVNRLTSVVRF